MLLISTKINKERKRLNALFRDHEAGLGCQLDCGFGRGEAVADLEVGVYVIVGPLQSVLFIFKAQNYLPTWFN